MAEFSRRLFLGSSLVVAGCSGTAGPLSIGKNGFQCPPCGCSEDGKVFDEPGVCSACGMSFEPLLQVDLGLEPEKLSPGGGYFTLGDSIGRPESPIRVDYYLPAEAIDDARIILVLPGTGRNSAEYRNFWLDYAVRNQAFVASLGYPQESYDFARYHMGGTIESFDTADIVSTQPNPVATILTASDEAFDVEIVSDPARWIFGDFDRVFERVKAAAKLTTTTYTLLGHSAGGQILHRAALFQPPEKADRIFAANSGFYTLPDLSIPVPLGLGGSGLDKAALTKAFSTPLTILVGEDDNRPDAGGTFLRTPALDQQGTSRLARGLSFYRAAQEQAEALGVPLAWEWVTVPGVGHDGRAIIDAAAGMI